VGPLFFLAAFGFLTATGETAVLALLGTGLAE
jgi:hypothetical protein